MAFGAALLHIAQSRRVQSPPVSRIRCVRSCRRCARDRPHRRTAAADAVDRVVVSDRLRGDRRVPPLNGFASEWLTLQSLLHVGLSDAAGVSFAGAVAAAALAATAALAAFCFVKVVGLVLLGAPRLPRPRMPWRAAARPAGNGPAGGDLCGSRRGSGAGCFPPWRASLRVIRASMPASRWTCPARAR